MLALWKHGDAYFTMGEGDATHRALPAAQYAAMVAERDALREALGGLVKAEDAMCDTNGSYYLFVKALDAARTALGAEKRGV